MIKEKVTDAFNQQFNKERFSAYFYLGMSAHSESLGLRGASHWFMAKHMEEQNHAMKIYRYILDQGAKVSLYSIDCPDQSFSGLMDMLEKTLSHEQQVTESFNILMDIALDEHDHASQIFLQWFVTEQIEEEATVGDLISRLRLAGDKGEGLFLIDNEMEKLAANMNTDMAPESAN